MTRKFTIRKVAVAALVCAALPLSSSIADNHEEEKERFFESQYRSDAMEHFNYSMKKLIPILKRTGNPDHLPAIANIMANTATITKSAFEKDTRGTEGFTKAKDTVWENWEDFSKRMDTLEKDTATFAEVAARTTDPTEIMTAFRGVARNCKGCHDEYKVR